MVSQFISTEMVIYGQVIFTHHKDSVVPTEGNPFTEDF